MTTDNVAAVELPPAKYAIGDRVTSPWGDATVIAVTDSDWFGSRCYRIKHDWSQSPPDFGHHFGEADLQPCRPAEAWLDEATEEEADAPEPADTPPPKFALGDRVLTQFGCPSTVVNVYPKAPSHPRMYLVAQDGGCNLGQSERELKPLGAEQPEPAAAQMTLF